MHPALGVLEFMRCLGRMRKNGVNIYLRGGHAPFSNLGQMAVSIKLVLHKFGVADVVITGSRRRPIFETTQRHVIYVSPGHPTDPGAIWANTETVVRASVPAHVLVLTWDMRATLECCRSGVTAVWFPVTWCTVPAPPAARPTPAVASNLAFAGLAHIVGRRKVLEALHARPDVTVNVIGGKTSVGMAEEIGRTGTGFVLELPWQRTHHRLSPGRFSMTCNLVEGGVPLATVGPLGDGYDSEWMRIMPPMHALLFDVSPTEGERKAAEAVNARWWAQHDAMDWPAYLHDLVIAAHIHVMSLDVPS